MKEILEFFIKLNFKESYKLVNKSQFHLLNRGNFKLFILNIPSVFIQLPFTPTHISP